MVHAYVREPSVCLFSVVEFLAVFEYREQELKAQSFMFFFKLSERKRRDNDMGLLPRYFL